MEGKSEDKGDQKSVQRTQFSDSGCQKLVTVLTYKDS